MAVSSDPNFPLGLDIHALPNLTSDADARFDATAQEDAIKSYGIAGRIWEASHAMLAYLDTSSSTMGIDFDPPPPLSSSRAHVTITAIELGSGTGFVAARVANWLCPDLDLLVATDLPDVCPLLETNLRSCSAVRVRPLAWGNAEHAQAILEELGVLKINRHHPSPQNCMRRLTHILCSDLIYFPELHAPLLRSLLHLTSPPPDLGHSCGVSAPPDWEPPSMIISYKIRSLSKETPFWNAFGLWFEYSPVLSRTQGTETERPASELPPSGRREGQEDDNKPSASWRRFSPGDDADEIFVLVATRRRASLGWQVPEEDSALLAGVGAYGSSSTKSDDQFERLLLFSMDI